MKKLLFLLLFFCEIASAAIYMQKDAQGNVTFTDTPAGNAEKIVLPNENSAASSTSSVQTANKPQEKTSPNTQQTNATPNTTQEALVKPAYQTFAIITPTDLATIQNQPVIPVELKIEPTLQKGDKVMLVLDGKPVGSPQASNHLSLNEVERGEHQLSAILIDASEKILKQANTITIYIHRANNFSRPPA